MAVRIGDFRGLRRIPKGPAEGPNRRMILPSAPAGGAPILPELIVNILAAANFKLVEDTAFQPAARRSLVSPRLDVVTTDSERVLLLEYAQVDSSTPNKKLDFYRFHRHDSPDVAHGTAGEVLRSFKRLKSPSRGISNFQAFSAPSASVLPVLTAQLMLRAGGVWRRVGDDETVSIKTKTIIMIHGFLSNVNSAFQNVDFTSAPANALLLGYNHETVFQAPKANADALVALLLKHLSLPDSPQTLDVICHSRGGLVAREFLNEIALNHTKRWTIDSLSTYGSPNLGTTLAVDALAILNIGVNAAIRGYLPGVPDIFSSMISEVAVHKALPGVDAMMPAKASGIPSSFKAAVLCMESAYAAKSDEWAKLLAAFLWKTAAFRGNANDLVVDVPYMSLGVATLSQPLEDHNHFRYFDRGYHGNKPF